MKTLVVFFFGTVLMSTSIAFAADPGVALREDAPVYAGPVQEGDLEELKVEDFENFGLEDDASPKDQYLQYRKSLALGVLGATVPYRLKIVDRDLSLDDFLGDDVSEELAEARYNGYLTMIPATVDGRTIHFVYVYHRPLAPKVSDSFTNSSQY